MSSYEQSFLQSFEKAKELNLCPNRLWNSAGENLDTILPDLDLIARLHNTSDEFRRYNNDNDHSNCTINLCEFSKRDFTSVLQRHECADPSNCLQLRVSFRAKILKEAVDNGQSTAWTPDRTGMLKSPLPYMAISHVWSDGTGAGSSGNGSLNDCLFRHFADIATQFQCRGSWWDTICIPRDKATRSKAIRGIHSSYENARFTLVHDCFLRNWVWGPDTACFAILMSPWFSRGWTALELLKSSKVKIIFKGPNGPIIKDLDEEILAKESDPDGPRKEASRIIRRLRHSILTVNDLLSVLKSRSTSWPKDIHVIAALLVDIIAAQGQQETYRKILMKIGKICHGHLFHNAVTMSNSFTWCPAELMEMPLDPAVPLLTVLHNGDVRGRWYVSALPADFETRCSLSSLIGLTRLRLKDALRYPTECWLLMECGKEQAERALVVRAMTKSHFQYIAAVNFHQGFIPASACEEIEVTVVSSPHDMEKVQPATEIDRKNSIASKGESLHSAIWKKEFDTFQKMLSSQNVEAPDELGRRPLHLAAERGSCNMVEQLLDLHVDTGAVCDEGQTALHKAAWAGSTEIVSMLLHSGMPDVYRKDKHQSSALHVAAQMGFAPIVKLLVTPDAINMRCVNGLTSLHHAAMNGDIEVAKLLIGSDLAARDTHFGWTPLHCAADNGNEEVVRLLLDNGADIQASDSLEEWTPLHLASMNGHVAAVKLLLERHAQVAVPDRCHWTAQKFAEINEHSEILALFPNDKTDDTVQDVPFPPDIYWTPLHCRAINKQPGITKILTRPDMMMYLEGDLKGWTPLKFSSRANLPVAFNRLFAESPSSSRRVEGSTLLHWAVRNHFYSATERLLKGGYDVKTTDSDGKRPLHYAALFADDLALQILLDAGADIHSTTPKRETVLHHAALNKKAEALRYLLECDIDTEVKDNTGSTPLMVAAQVGNEAAIRFLLEVGANKEATASFERTPLMFAASTGQTAATRLLVNYGVDVNASDAHKLTALHWASRHGHKATVDVLVDSGAKLDALDAEDKTALMYAAENGSAEVADRLVRSGADVEFAALTEEETGYRKITALQLACMHGHEDIVRLLVGVSVDIDMCGCPGLAPIHFAAVGGHEGTMRLLIDASADIENRAERGYGDTSLQLASKEGHGGIVRMLISAGADMELVSFGGQRALCQAAEAGHEDIVRLLIDSGTYPDQDFDRAQGNHSTPLLYAASKGYEGIVQTLLKGGADVDQKTPREGTALSLAASKGYENIVQMLLAAGADPKSREPDNVARLQGPPVCQAARGGHEGTVRILLNAGADIEICGSNGLTPLREAAWQGHEKVVRLLIERGANLEAGSSDLLPKWSLSRYQEADWNDDWFSCTSLILAARTDHTMVVWTLIQAGANLEARDDTRRTALHWAAFRNNFTMVHHLLQEGADATVRDDQRHTPWDLATNEEVQNLCAVESRRLRGKVKRLWSRHVRVPSTTD